MPEVKVCTIANEVFSHDYKATYRFDDETECSLLFNSVDTKDLKQFASNLAVGKNTIWDINSTDGYTGFKLADGIYTHTSDGYGDGAVGGTFKTRLNDVIVAAWQKVVSDATKSTAQYVGPGLTWKCPRCNRENTHNYPYHGRSMNDMVGSSRCCDECGFDYRLGDPKDKNEQTRRIEQENQPTIY